MEMLISLAGWVGSVLEFLIGVRSPPQRTPASSAASRPETNKRMRWRRYCPRHYDSVRLDSERLWDDMHREFRLLTGNPRAIKQVLGTCGAYLTRRVPAPHPGGPWTPVTRTVSRGNASPIAPPPPVMLRDSPCSVASRAFWDAFAIAALASVVGGMMVLLTRVTPLAPLIGVDIFFTVSVIALVGWALRALIRRGKGKPDTYEVV